MDFKLFSRLYDEAQEYTNVDMYIGERGWQEWMDSYDDKGADIGSLLTKIWDFAHMDIKALRTTLGLSQVSFSQLYSIPTRTIENWDSGTRVPPPYLSKLIAYSVFTLVDN